MLAVEILRSGFESALAESCLSHFGRAVRPDLDTWATWAERSPVRVPGAWNGRCDSDPCSSSRCRWVWRVRLSTAMSTIGRWPSRIVTSLVVRCGCSFGGRVARRRSVLPVPAERRPGGSQWSHRQDRVVAWWSW